MADIIKLEDIQDLQITKKFVRIESSKYDEPAYDYVRTLIDNERAILFDKDTHRIYTLGDYYGGDTIKEKLFYFSSILNIDDENEILNKIESTKNEDSLSIHGVDGIVITFKDRNKIDIGIDVKSLISENSTQIKLDEKVYSLKATSDNKLDLSEYQVPSVELLKTSIDFINNDIIDVEIPFELKGSLDINELDYFRVNVENCQLISLDKENKKINIKTQSRHLSPILYISYKDQYIERTIKFNIDWTVKCYYGIWYDGTEYIVGDFDINNWKIDNYINLYQVQDEYGYFKCPIDCMPMFIDDNTKIQGAWHKTKIIDTINRISYKSYITDNDNLGKNEWHIINKK